MKKKVTIMILSCILVISMNFVKLEENRFSENNNKNQTVNVQKINKELDSKTIDLLIECNRHFKTTFDSKIESDDLVSVKNKYKENLEYICKSLDITIKYDEREIDEVLSYYKGKDFINNGFNMSNIDYNNMLKKIRDNKNTNILEDAAKIVYNVYTNEFEGNNNYYLNDDISWGCGISLAGNFVATLGLGSCVTLVSCPLAIAGKAIALAGVANSCF